MQIAGWLLLVLAIPRVLRLLWPEVWVEDDFYLESAYLVSAGLRPYLDFVHPHLPLLEWIAAAYLRLFGASHRSIEVLNESAIYLASLLTFALGRRALSARVAATGAILYAFSSLVFRYHVYERECFLAPAILIAALGALDRDSTALRQTAQIALALIFACAVKLTAGIGCAVVLLYLALVERRWLRAIAAGGVTLAGLGLLSLICYRLYGFEFLFQTFIFHFMKGEVSYPVQVLDVLAPLFVLGCIAVASDPSKATRALVLVFMMVAGEYLFYGILSPTVWGHNYLEFLPYVAIVAGAGLDYVADAARSIASGARIGAAWLRLAGAAIIIVVMLGWLTPLVNQNWLNGSVYGFGFMPRDEIEQLGAALRDASAVGDEVIAPAFIAFEANRRELIRYPETYGVYREAKDEFLHDGFGAARAHLGHAGFFQLIVSTARFWTAPIRDAIVSGRVRAVIPDSPSLFLPLVRLDPEFLAQNGFRPALQTEHFTLWVRESASAEPH